MTHASFRLIFFFNLPLGAVVATLATRRVAETRDEEASGPVDVAGALLAVAGLGAIVWALLEAPSHGGIAALHSLIPLLSGIATLGVFVVVESRARAPMVPLSLFRSRTFAGANLTTLLLYAALGACFFFVPFDLIQVQRYSPAEAGAALLPFIVLISSMSRWAGGLVPRYGARLPLVIGPLVSAAGFALVAMPSVGGSYWSTFFPAMIVLGLGMGLTVAPLTTAVMTAVDARYAGVASGINNAVSRAAGLLAIAALGIVLVARFDSELDREIPALGLPEEAVAVLARERPKLAAAELPPGLDPSARNAIRRSLDSAFVAGFRALMLACAALATLSAAASAALVSGRGGPLGAGSGDARPRPPSA